MWRYMIWGASHAYEHEFHNLVRNYCPKLEMSFSRAELHSRPGEARSVVQSATPGLDLRD